MPLHRLLEDAHDQRVERGLLFLGPAGKTFVKIGWHTNLEVDDGFRHGKSPLGRWLNAISSSLANPMRTVKYYLLMLVR